VEAGVLEPFGSVGHQDLYSAPDIMKAVQ
jgi:hypothetical protein